MLLDEATNSDSSAHTASESAGLKEKIDQRIMSHRYVLLAVAFVAPLIDHEEAEEERRRWVDGEWGAI